MFAHLHCHSPYSFLDGASSIDDLLDQALAVGAGCLALTDHNNVSGAVEFFLKARERDIKPLLGAEVTMAGGRGSLVLLAENQQGYYNLCRLLSRAHMENVRRQPSLSIEALQESKKGIIALSGGRRGAISSLILKRKWREAESLTRKYVDILGADNFFLEIQGDLLPGNRQLHHHLDHLGESLGVKLVSTNNVHFASKGDFPVHDLLACVRTRTSLSQVHPERRMNAENYLKSAREMRLALGGFDESMEVASSIAQRCQPGIILRDRDCPRFDPPHDIKPYEYLRYLVHSGALQRYGRVTDTISDRLREELTVIRDMGLSEYFLMVWDVVNFARQRGIRYAGRGSAADSAVAYCLFITEVDAISRRHLFQRFINPERGEKPDIDIDFDARRRDEVIEYVVNRYGQERVARVATFNTFRARSAVREIGQAMEFSPQEIDRLAKTLPHLSAGEVERAVSNLPEFRGKNYGGKYMRLFEAASQVAGFPRHLGTHLGGLVMSRRSLFHVTALQEAAMGDIVCQLDKRGIEDAGLIKLDLLSLRTMSAIEDTVKEIRVVDPDFSYDDLPVDDAETFSLIASGNTLGVFQLESPAQRALQKRLKAHSLEDIIASVALIRPGPIKGNMVEPFLARREGREPVTYPHPSLKPILEKTLGVVLFQEQVIEIATAIAGFTPGEADQLRRVMTHARSHGDMEKIGKQFMTRAVARGVTEEIASAVLSYIESYASYGFCEAHAAAFGLTAYKTAYLLRHYPLQYLCALMNQQPMGYYPLHTLGVECQRRGIEVLPLDINCSSLKFKVEGSGIRVPITLVKGLSLKEAHEIVKTVDAHGPFESWDDFRLKTHLHRDSLENLILAGALDSMNSNRRQLLWKMADSSGNLGKEITDFTPMEKLDLEYRILGMFVSGHPLGIYRQKLRARGFVDSGEIKDLPALKPIKTAGIPVRPHRPPTRSGKVVVFLSLEDELGIIDVTVFESVYQRYGHLLFGDTPPILAVEGYLDEERAGFSVIARGIRGIEGRGL